MTDYAQVVSERPRLQQNQISSLFSAFRSSLKHTQNSVGSHTKSILSKKKFGTILLIVIVGLLIMASVRMAISRVRNSEQLGPVSAEALTTPVEREFSFIVYDKDKQLSDQVRYAITIAQLTKQIIIKGQRATAVKGRIFLILNLKLVNEFDKSLFLNTRNYVRVQPSGTKDRLAPEIHNDTVEVQPLSTKITRIGLPVNETDKVFTLYVGELNGYKEEITIKF